MSSSSDVTEITPLIGRRNLQNDEEDRPRIVCNPSLWIILIVFLFGASIGGYLLIVQDQAYPVSKPFFLVLRSQWENSSTTNRSGVPFPNTTVPVSCVFVTQVRNSSCWTLRGCSRVIRDIQKCDTSGDVPFNFLVGGDGRTYEGQGWNNQSLLRDRRPLKGANGSFPWSSCLVLSFIGNFTVSPPVRDQLDEGRVWLAESITRKRLREPYNIYGLRNLTASSNDGESLFAAVANSWPHYNQTLGAYL